ncbi:hypothetical protein H0H87_010343, partial [Tephrocybe sp. NHM501043]
QGAFLLAAYRQHMGIVQWLAKKGLGMKGNKFLMPIISSAQEGNEDIVKVLAEVSMNIEIKDNELQRAFANAAGNGLAAAVNVLKELVVSRSCTAKYEQGETPLHKAAAGGHLDIVKIFVDDKDQGFDINTQSDSGNTPLHKAACNGHAEVVKLLLDYEAEEWRTNKDGLTVLHVAARQGHAEVVKQLLKSGAYVNAESGSGKTSLHIAAKNGQSEVVKQLLEGGAAVNAKGQKAESWTMSGM